MDLNRMLHQVVSEFQPMLAEKSMTCHLALPDKLSCSCDPDKLARVFDNLLRNACHYGLPGTDIRIAGEIDGGRAVLTFSNAGRTIPQEKLERTLSSSSAWTAPAPPGRGAPGPWLGHSPRRS